VKTIKIPSQNNTITQQKYVVISSLANCIGIIPYLCRKFKWCKNYYALTKDKQLE